MEACQGKSNYFLEHHAMLANEGEASYSQAPHAWCFAYRPPIPYYPREEAIAEQPDQQITNKNSKNEYHINIIKIALDSYNKANGNLDFEFDGDTRISTIDEFGSTYHHYNFRVLSPTTLVAETFFAEVDAGIHDEHSVHVCCPLLVDSEEFGICYGCALLQPNTEDYVAGRKNIWTPLRGYCPYGEEEDFD